MTYINGPLGAPIACGCADDECRRYGCKLQRRQWNQPTWPLPASYQPGCICPPTSEQTCQADWCPRKSRLAQGIEAGTATTEGRGPKDESPVTK